MLGENKINKILKRSYKLRLVGDYNTPVLLTLIGHASTIADKVYPTKYLPVIGYVITANNTVEHLIHGQPTQAAWDVIEAAGGMYTTAIYGFGYLSQTYYVQYGAGTIWYEEMMLNINLYNKTGNEKFLDRAAHAQEEMMDYGKTMLKNRN